MRLAIMQPYFFPYLGYYSLISYSPNLILFDSVQFIRHGWIERNRILKPLEGWQYISVPLRKHNRETIIKDIVIKHEEDWKGRIYRQLEHYKKKAPFYNETMETIIKSLDIETESIVELNKNILITTCGYLNLPLQIDVSSKLNLNLGIIQEPDEWALGICKELNAKIYVNPYGGKEIFTIQKYTSNKIEISFLKNNLSIYSQRRSVFEAGLSIIDVLMFNEPNKILNYINDFSIVP